MADRDRDEDQELLRAMLAGDEESFAALYTRRQGTLYRFALHMTGSAALAEDVTHDVFVSLMDSGKRYDPARGTLISFLYGIARNLILRRLDKQRTEPPVAAEETTGEEEDLLDGLTRRETIDQVRRAVVSLPPAYREVVVLCDLEGATYEAAAAALECRIGTVRSRLSRGRAMLAEKLGNTFRARSVSCAARSVSHE